MYTVGSFSRSALSLALRKSFLLDFGLRVDKVTVIRQPEEGSQEPCLDSTLQKIQEGYDGLRIERVLKRSGERWDTLIWGV